MTIWDVITITIQPVFLVGLGVVIVCMMVYLFIKTLNHSWILLAAAVLVWMLFDVLRIIEPDNMAMGIAMSRIGRLWLKIVFIYVCYRAIRNLS
jgi:hypothetical protein